MSRSGGRFRRALFGGFHRGDVLEYLEESKRAFREELEEQQARQEAAMEEAMEEQARQLESLECQIEEMRPQVESWKQIQGSTGEITVSAFAHAQTTIRMADEQVRLMTNKADERARATIQAANEKAAKVREESIRLVETVQEHLVVLQRDFHQTVVWIEEELDAARTSLRQAEEEMRNIQSMLAELAGIEVTIESVADLAADIQMGSQKDEGNLNAMVSLDTLEEGDGLENLEAQKDRKEPTKPDREPGERQEKEASKKLSFAEQH